MIELLPPLPQPAPSAPAYALYDDRAVLLATFLGSPAAGVVPMALNYRRLGQSGNAWASVALGVLATIALLALAMALPSKTPGMLFVIPQIFGMKYIAKNLQGPTVEADRNAGGKLASMWKAAGIGVVGLIVVIGGVLLYVLFSGPDLGTKISLGTKDEIYYRGAATESEARALGAAVQQAGFLTDRGVSVALSKSSEGTIISFVVGEGAWDDAKTIAAFELIGRAVAPSVGGLPIKIRLMTSELDVKKELDVK